MCSEMTIDILSKLILQAEEDPQLPRANPTESFWQIPPHPTLSNIQSDTLPSTIDFAIIGSGITGCSVAKTLFEEAPSSHESFTVTVFEARKLTSGATGRNGGILASFVPASYKLLSESLGHDEAVKIARYANRTLEKMHALGRSSDELQCASEVRRLTEIIGFGDAESLQAVLESFRLYEEHVPEDKGQHQAISSEDAARVGDCVTSTNGNPWLSVNITRTAIYVQLLEPF
jgi:choline dehydrogenase-like flavoprotein